MPKIHSELELVYAFIIKLRPDISKDLISRDFHTFMTLQPLIAGAQCYESHAGRAAQPHDDNIELCSRNLSLLQITIKDLLKQPIYCILMDNIKDQIPGHCLSTLPKTKVLNYIVLVRIHIGQSLM